jgi:hypothetical protein
MDVFERFKRFTPLGLRVPEADLKTLSSLIESKDNLIAFSKNLREKPSKPSDLLQGDVHPTRIVLAALALDETLQKTLERFHCFAPVLGLRLPEGEPDSWQLCTGEHLL